MSATIKNILIFGGIGVVLIFVYVFFIKKTDVPNLSSTSTTDSTNLAPAGTSNGSMSDSEDFLSVLLSVNNIKLDDSIFSDPAFQNLHDSSIVLVPDATEGRPNPFAPLGEENVTSTPPTVTNSVPSSTTQSSVVPPTPATGSTTTPPSGAKAGSSKTSL